MMKRQTARRIYVAVYAVVSLAAFLCVAQEQEDQDESDSEESRNYGTPILQEISREERAKAARDLKRVEGRSKAFKIFLNRGKMEKLKGERLLRVLGEYDRFVGTQGPQNQQTKSFRL